jgi:hypothetical protein
VAFRMNCRVVRGSVHPLSICLHNSEEERRFQRRRVVAGQEVAASRIRRPTVTCAGHPGRMAQVTALYLCIVAAAAALLTILAVYAPPM